MAFLKKGLSIFQKVFDIYSWDYITLVIVLFVVALAFLVIKHFMRRHKVIYNRISTTCFFVYVALIFIVTVLNRTRNSPDFGVSLIPFSSYRLMRQGNLELFRESVMNIAFFYPVGFLFCCIDTKKLQEKKWLIIVFSCAYSIIIEICQYIFRLGWVETDDVIHNTLGCALGMLAYILLDYLTFNERDF